MDLNDYQKHFEAGFFKRAEELGLNKEAFVPALLAGLANVGLNIGGQVAAIKGMHRLSQLAKAPVLKGQKMSLLNKARNKGIDTAGKLTGYLTSQGPENIGKSMVANTGLSMAVGSAVDPIAQRINNAILPQENTYANSNQHGPY
jgi:hypothetical protein